MKYKEENEGPIKGLLSKSKSLEVPVQFWIMVKTIKGRVWKYFAKRVAMYNFIITKLEL